MQFKTSQVCQEEQNIDCVVLQDSCRPFLRPMLSNDFISYKPKEAFRFLLEFENQEHTQQFLDVLIDGIDAVCYFPYLLEFSEGLQYLITMKSDLLENLKEWEEYDIYCLIHLSYNHSPYALPFIKSEFERLLKSGRCFLESINWKVFLQNPNCIPLLMEPDYIEPKIEGTILDKILDRYRYNNQIPWYYLCRNTNPDVIPLLEKHQDLIRWNLLSKNPLAIPLLKKNVYNTYINSLSLNPNSEVVPLIKELIMNTEKVKRYDEFGTVKYPFNYIIDWEIFAKSPWLDILIEDTDIPELTRWSLECVKNKNNTSSTFKVEDVKFQRKLLDYYSSPIAFPEFYNEFRKELLTHPLMIHHMYGISLETSYIVNLGKDMFGVEKLSNDQFLKATSIVSKMYDDVIEIILKSFEITEEEQQLPIIVNSEDYDFHYNGPRIIVENFSFRYYDD